MSQERLPPTPLRSLLLVGAIVVVAMIGLLLFRPGAPEARRDGATESDDLPAPASLLESSGDRPPANRPAPLAERLPTPELSDEDLWAMVPDEHQRQELLDQEFELGGGIDTPGTDPERARLEVDEPGWSERTAAELRHSLESRAVVRGVTIQNLDCQRGRCLVELTFQGMNQAFERMTALRAWAAEDVRCRTYSDGPIDEETPHLAENQQIWILCGEPSAR